MSFHWICDNILTERAGPTGLPTLEEAVERCGDIVHSVKYIPIKRMFENQNVFNKISGLDFVIFHGTLEGLNAVKRYMKRTNTPWAPVWFGDFDRDFSYSGASSLFGEAMLNNEFVLLPIAEIKRRKEDLLDSFNGQFFIRPNKVTKTFAARTINHENFDLELNCLNNYEVTDLRELAVIAPVQSLDFEFRFIVVDHKIVAMSQYQYKNKLDIRIDVKQEALDFAEKQASKFNVDDDAPQVYVMDIGITSEGRVAIIELNTFNCAGLYACDTVAIVKAIQAHIKEIYDLAF